MGSHVVYAIDNAGSGASAHNVYKTTDGSTWSLFLGDITGDLSGLFYFWVDENNSNQNAVAISGSNLCYYTTDGGTTWNGPITPPASMLLMAVLPDGTLLAAGCAAFAAYKVAYSTDGGSTWTTVTLPSQSSKMLMLNSATDVRFAGFVRLPSGQIYVAGMDTTNNVFMVWRSTDEGVTWNVALNQSGATNAVVGWSAKGTVLMYPFNTTTGIKMYWSQDSGSSWTTKTIDGATHGSFGGGQYSSIALPLFTNNPGLMSDGSWLCMASYVNDGFGDTTVIFLRSTDSGATWAVDATVTGISGNGYTTATLWSDTAGVSWCSVLTKDVFRSSDGGVTWTVVMASPWTSSLTVNRFFSTPTPPQTYNESIALSGTGSFVLTGVNVVVTNVDEIGRIIFGLIDAEHGRLDTNGPLEEHGRFIFFRILHGDDASMSGTGHFTTTASLIINALIALDPVARFLVSDAASPVHEVGQFVAAALITCGIEPELSLLVAAAYLTGFEEQSFSCGNVRDIDSDVEWEH